MKSQKVTKKQKRLIYMFRAISVRIFAAVMVIGGFLGLLFFVRPDTSEVEKRTLTEFPKRLFLRCGMENFSRPFSVVF